MLYWVAFGVVLHDSLCTKGGRQQTLEKIVRCPVLLDDHDDMLETRHLRVSEQRPKEKQQ